MSRYRPPAPPKAPYITPEGYDHLEQEMKDIWVRRRDVTAALAAAAAEGDRSENAEYIYRKRELAGLDRRIRYLQVRMPKLNVVRRTPDDASQVFFGAWVKLEDHKGQPCEYRLVGPDEIDRHENYISIDSPLAQALLKKTVQDEVVVNTPRATVSYTVLEVRYD